MSAREGMKGGTAARVVLSADCVVGSKGDFLFC